MKHKTILACILTAALSLSLLLAACGQEENHPTADVNINYGISNAWDALMPYYSVSGSNYSRIIYDKLYDRLAYVEPDGTCLPRGAANWESADDGYSIVFHIDPDAAFHDGTPVTAQHWVDTIALVTDPACDTLGRTTFADVVGTDDTGAAIPGETLGVALLDDMSFKITFTHVVIPEEFLVENNRDIYVLPTHLLTDIPAEEMVTADFWTSPIGSGPCKFVSELTGSTLVLEANKDYQLGAPGFDTMTITVMDKANLLTALISGDLDYYAFGGSVSEENRAIAEDAGFTVIEGEVPSTFYELMVNNETVSDKTIRQAIDLALDKQLLCQQSTGTMGTVTDTSLLPGTYRARTDAAPGYDPETAKKLLAQSDYAGEVYTLATTSARADLAALIQQDLAEIGVTIQIETVDSATMFAGMYDGTYDLAVASHTPTSLPLWFTGGRFTEEDNLFRVGDLSRYIELVTAIRNELDETARAELVTELDEYLREELPFIPLWFYRSLHVQSKTVTGIDYPASSFCNENVWEWEKA